MVAPTKTPRYLYMVQTYDHASGNWLTTFSTKHSVEIWEVGERLRMQGVRVRYVRQRGSEALQKYDPVYGRFLKWEI